MRSAVEAFCENVRNVLCAENFKQLDLLASDFVLDSQVRHIQVTDLAKTLAPCNTNCGRSVAVYTDRHRPAHVTHECLDSKGVRTTRRYAVEFRLSGIQRNSCLRAGPMFN